MPYRRTRRFKRAYRRLPDEIKTKVAKAFELFKQNPWHPSLRIKKMEGTDNTFEGRIDRNYRFTFYYDGDVVIFRNIGKHHILDDETD